MPVFSILIFIISCHSTDSFPFHTEPRPNLQISTPILLPAPPPLTVSTRFIIIIIMLLFFYLLAQSHTPLGLLKLTSQRVGGAYSGSGSAHCTTELGMHTEIFLAVTSDIGCHGNVVWVCFSRLWLNFGWRNHQRLLIQKVVGLHLFKYI